MLRFITKKFLGLRNEFLFCPLRGVKTGIAELRKGDWIEHEGKIFVIQQITSTHSGRGSRSFHLAMKDAIGVSQISLKPTPRDTFEKLEMQDVPHKYLYEAEGIAYFMNSKTLEEICLPKNCLVGNLGVLLEGGMDVKIRMNKEKPVMAYSGPKNLQCTISKVLERRLTQGSPTYSLCECDELHLFIESGRNTIIVETLGGGKIECHVEVEEGDQILVALEDLTYQGRIPKRLSSS